MGCLKDHIFSIFMSIEAILLQVLPQHWSTLCTIKVISFRLKL